MLKTKTRESNIELLRMVTMLLIVMYHIVYHALQGQLGESYLFHEPVFYKKLIILLVIYTFGNVGNMIFMLITGYFMANRTEAEGKRIDLGKISYKLLTQLAFVTVVMMIVSLIVNRFVSNATVTILGISLFNKSSWYIGYYFAVVLIAVLFLNNTLAGLDAKRYLTFCVAGLAFASFYWTSSLANALVYTLTDLIAGVSMYALGGYIRRYDPFKNVRTYVFFVVIFLMYGLIALSYYGSVQMEIQNYAATKSVGGIAQSIAIYDRSSIMTIVISIPVFELFRRIKMPKSGLVNFLGASTLTVYLVHDNAFFYSLWRMQDWVTMLHDTPALFAAQLCKWTLITFLSGVAVYALYLVSARGAKKLKPLLVKKEVER